MSDHRADLLLPVSKAIYEAQWDESFDDLNPAGIDYAMALQLGRAAIAAMASVLLAPSHQEMKP